MLSQQSVSIICHYLCKLPSRTLFANETKFRSQKWWCCYPSLGRYNEQAAVRACKHDRTRSRKRLVSQLMKTTIFDPVARDMIRMMSRMMYNCIQCVQKILFGLVLRWDTRIEQWLYLQYQIWWYFRGLGKMMKNQFFVGIGYNYLIARCVDEVYEIFFYSFIQVLSFVDFIERRQLWLLTATCTFIWVLYRSQGDRTLDHYQIWISPIIVQLQPTDDIQSSSLAFIQSLSRNAHPGYSTNEIS